MGKGYGIYAALAAVGGTFAAAVDSVIVLGLVMAAVGLLMYTDGKFSNE